MSNVLSNVGDVVDWRLCLGCGACAHVCPEQKVKIVDVIEQGLRPVLSEGPCRDASCTICLQVCPGVAIGPASTTPSADTIEALSRSWGPVLEVWEGHAADEKMRFDGSSAGVASALASFCIESLGMRGALHVRGGDGTAPHLNETVFSRTHAELLAATGSRYAPAAPCIRLDTIERAGGACVFLGKPCDVEALRKAQALRPALARNIGVAIGIFCAGTPSTQGTHDLLRKFGVPLEDVEEVRYRGRGWPGTFAVRMKGSSEWRELATYAEAWSFLQAYRPYRCHLCPDGTAEFADISCGDPWYRNIEPGEPGSSLVVVRTEVGRRIVRQAIEAGAVHVSRVAPDKLEQSQRELQAKRGAIWGRVLTMRALGIPAPKLHGFSLLANWMILPLKQKLRSLLGTARRVLSRKYYRRHDSLPRRSQS